MNIGEWWEMLLTFENRLAGCIQEFYPDAEADFHQACRNKQDGEIHRILHETWFRSSEKEYGPDGWQVLCDLISAYPN
jgi:hypothetical protein